MGHFGHFLLETLTSLWPHPSTVDGVVFHLWPSDTYAVPPLPWQGRLLQRAGWNVPVHIVQKAPVQIERLLLPTRAYRLHRGALPEAVSVWEAIAPQRARQLDVFLSRSRLTNDPRRLPGDDALDISLAEQGYLVEIGRAHV